MTAERGSERGMRVCNERSGNETGLYTMLSRPARGHVEHDDGRTGGGGSGELHRFGIKDTGLMRGMWLWIAMREMEMVLLGVGYLVFLPESKTQDIIPKCAKNTMSSATGQASFTARPSFSRQSPLHASTIRTHLSDFQNHARVFVFNSAAYISKHRMCAASCLLSTTYQFYRKHYGLGS